jgi:hypothetical protein
LSSFNAFYEKNEKAVMFKLIYILKDNINQKDIKINCKNHFLKFEIKHRNGNFKFEQPIEILLFFSVFNNNLLSSKFISSCLARLLTNAIKKKTDQ